MATLRLSTQSTLEPNATTAVPADVPDPEPAKAQRLLIVNADDFGRDTRTTNAILDCYSAAGITSTSGMVGMKDSRRARDLAEEAGIPVGLHLNLTAPFTDPDLPASSRERHAELVKYFRGPARWLFNPLIRRRVDQAITEQIDQYSMLYGRLPSHLDGHQHIHITPNVLTARAFPPELTVRPSFTFLPGEKSVLNRAVRRGINTYISRRFNSPGYFFSIRTLHPALGGSGMARKLMLAKHGTVEIMCHPALGDEFRVVNSDEWQSAISSVQLGTYHDLK
jgi:predicted glycoside hydrolase/deacetylase ChbG (UPF0249 family)